MATKQRTIPPHREQDIQRFWSHVNKSPGQGPQGDCWEWKLTTDKDGYGHWSVSANHQQHNLRANRVAYFLQHNEDPIGFLVCHTCDNPPCCRPEHLFKDTPQGNMDDKHRKNRQRYCGPYDPARGDRNAARLYPEKWRRGEKINTSRLVPDQIPIIRQRYDAGGIFQYQLAEEYGVGQSTIGRIIRREYWKHIK